MGLFIQVDEDKAISVPDALACGDYPHPRFLSPAVRAFADWLAELVRDGDSAIAN